MSASKGITMNSLKDYDDVQLTAELDRRKREREQTAMPRINQSPPGLIRWEQFTKFMQKYVDDITSEDWHEDDCHDWSCYIYEEACKLAFGDCFFHWFNNRDQ